MNQDFRIFTPQEQHNTGSEIHKGALVAPGVFACGLVFAVGTNSGQQLIDATLNSIQIPAIPWQTYFGGFETLVAGTAPVFWAFFLLSTIGLFLLRRIPADWKQPFRVPWYPLPPIIFVAVCCYMLYSSIAYAGWLSLLGIAPLIPGIAVFLLIRRRS